MAGNRQASTPAIVDSGAERKVQAAAKLRELRRALTAAPLQRAVYGDHMTLAQADALDQLVARDRMRIGDLASALRVDASTATRTVDGLVEAGLATRLEVAEDGRGVLVAVTDEGRRRYGIITQRRVEVMGELLADFTEEQEKRFVAALDGVIQALDAAAERRRNVC